MKKKALHKDFRIEIKKTWTRFLSILLIVALGVAMFAGLRACKDDMLQSADEYYDSTNLMDLRVLSTLGLTEDDVEAISKLDGVSAVEGAYSKDVLVHLKDSDIVVKTYSLNDRVNKAKLIEGRFPENNSECLVDTLLLDSTGYKVGDTITLSLPEGDLKDDLKETSLTIVGSCTDSRYMSFSRGNGTIGDGKISSFIILPKENFKQDVYTELYVTVKDAMEFNSYSKEYEDRVKTVQENIEAITKERGSIRYEEVTREPREELEKGEQELAKAKKDLRQKEEETYAKIEKGNSSIEEAQTTLTAAKEELENKKVLLSATYPIEEIDKMFAPEEAKLKVSEDELKKQKVVLEEQRAIAKEQFAKAKEEIAANEITLQEGREELAKIEPPTWYVLNRDTIESFVSYEMDADRMDAIARVFPSIFFFVAALVCLTTMTRMVDEQRTQIGILKALGYGKMSIAGKFIKYALFATVSGSIIGVLIGQKIFPYIVINAYRIMYDSLPVISIPYRPYYAIMAGSFAVLCTMLVTFMACMKDLKSEPAQLMRPIAPKAGRRILLERIGFIWNRLNFTKKSTLRNLFRYKKRFYMTTIGIAGCMALIIVGFGIRDSIGVMSELQYTELFHQDASISLTDKITKENRDSLIPEILEDDRVLNATSILDKSLKFSNGSLNRSASLLVVESGSNYNEFYTFRDRITKTTYHLNEDGVIITEKLAKLLSLSVGDTITIEMDNFNKQNVVVTAISENYMGHYVFMTSDLYQSLYGEDPSYNQILLINKSHATDFEEGLFRDLLVKYKDIMAISSTNTFNNHIDDMLSSLNIIVYVLIICAGMLAFIVLYNLSNININERKRELASLKVLGFYDVEVNSYVMKENNLLTFIGMIFGVFFGIVLHRYIIITCEVDMVMFGRLIKPISLIFSAGITMVFTLVISLFMYFKLRKIDMIESLKSVE
ncbi:MAG TPA: cell division protein FtsX [Lachnoclostridium phytofermentans]|uniref:Cell division protein FtsX n=1 Tax=Lachnoclostridium phytofermentans TaxID=66219 RepID=A0A3D2XAA8_9FIRM|nr:FtsX-like permease family protein [Lachnoclostridium sp.]HCL03533.1 cell division protein FtsX [Lachnoclostridium phytofermentans]